MSPVADIPNRPAGSDVRSIEAITENFNALITVLNALDGSNYGDSTVTDAKLASPSNSVYRSIVRVAGYGTAWGALNFVYADQGWTNAGANNAAAYLFVPVRAADWAVPNKTTKLRIRGRYTSNPTLAGRNFVFGLYSLGAISGAAGQIAFSSMTAAKTETFAANPAAGAVTAKDGADLDLPADGDYVIGCQPSGAATAGHMGILSIDIGVRNV